MKPFIKFRKFENAFSKRPAGPAPPGQAGPAWRGLAWLARLAWLALTPKTFPKPGVWGALRFNILKNDVFQAPTLNVSQRYPSSSLSLLSSIMFKPIKREAFPHDTGGQQEFPKFLGCACEASASYLVVIGTYSHYLLVQTIAYYLLSYKRSLVAGCVNTH